MAKPQTHCRDGSLEVPDLPEGWSLPRLAQLATDVQPGFACGRHADSATGIPQLRPMNVTRAGNIDLKTLVYVPKAEASRDERWLRQGDIVFNNTNSAELVGKTACYDLPEPRAFSNHMTRVRCDGRALDPRFCALALHEKWLQGHFESICNNHVSQASVGRKALLETLIPLPPLAEQKRILAKVEALLARVNASRARLARVSTMLKRFRQSALAAASSGRLTAAWRESHPDVERASELVARIGVECQRDGGGVESGLSEIPDKWVWLRFDFLIGELRNGISTKPNIDPPGTKILRISSVRVGSVSLNDVRFLPKAHDLISFYRLRNDDLLFTRYNGSLDLLGVCGMVRGIPEEAVLYPDKLIRVRFDHTYVLPAFVEIFFQSPEARDRLTAKAKSSAGQQGVSGADIRVQPIALPPLEEQREIVRRVEALFKLADAIEKRVQTATARAERLKQSILAKAFRGELVPTEAELARHDGRSYESASTLLDRISRQPDNSIAPDGARRTRRAATLHTQSNP